MELGKFFYFQVCEQNKQLLLSVHASCNAFVHNTPNITYSDKPQISGTLSEVYVFH